MKFVIIGCNCVSIMCRQITCVISHFITTRFNRFDHNKFHISISVLSLLFCIPLYFKGTISKIFALKYPKTTSIILYILYTYIIPNVSNDI